MKKQLAKDENQLQFRMYKDNIIIRPKPRKNKEKSVFEGALPNLFQVLDLGAFWDVYQINL